MNKVHLIYKDGSAFSREQTGIIHGFTDEAVADKYVAMTPRARKISVDVDVPGVLAAIADGMLSWRVGISFADFATADSNYLSVSVRQCEPSAPSIVTLSDENFHFVINARDEDAAFALASELRAMLRADASIEDVSRLIGAVRTSHN